MKTTILKRVFATAIAVMAAAGLSACGNTAPTTETPTSQTESIVTTTETSVTSTTEATTSTTAPIDATPSYIVDVQELKKLGTSDDFALKVESTAIEDGKATINVVNRSAENFKTMTLYMVAYNADGEAAWVNSKSTSTTHISSLVPIMTGTFSVGETRTLRIPCDPDNTAEVQVIVASYKTTDEAVTENPIAQAWAEAAFIPNPAV